MDINSVRVVLEQHRELREFVDLMVQFLKNSSFEVVENDSQFTALNLICEDESLSTKLLQIKDQLLPI